MQLAAATTQIGPCDLCGIHGHSSEACAAILEQQSSEQVDYMGNAPRQPNFDPYLKTQYNNNFQQPNPSLVQPNTSTQSFELELALQKLTLSTATFVDGITNFMNETKATSKNQEAAIRNLEVQVGQIAKQLSNGKVVGEEITQSDEEVPNEDKKQKEAHAPSLPIPIVKPYEPRIPYPQRLQG
ncbi:hypothetical protein PIB30_053002 [Stylosanthes scabra]|uniref:Retrotransposon gag protein n=1 Tax=Stylosanthes scabra TaxID=79078 RepID=A0ABU6XGK6_9FABA|nr:hypothetical protein [Stylosanthes scabra]